MAFVKRAYDIARKQVFFCDSSQPISQIAKLMYSKNIGSVIVKRKDELVGIITVNDMLRSVTKKLDPEETVAKDIMSSPLITAGKDLEIDELVDKFNAHRVSRMVLLDKEKRPVGVVRDIAVYKYMTFYKYDEEARKSFARDYMNKLY